VVQTRQELALHVKLVDSYCVIGLLLTQYLQGLDSRISEDFGIIHDHMKFSIMLFGAFELARH
jgi:hypothetical protein